MIGKYKRAAEEKYIGGIISCVRNDTIIYSVIKLPFDLTGTSIVKIWLINTFTTLRLYEAQDTKQRHSQSPTDCPTTLWRQHEHSCRDRDLHDTFSGGCCVHVAYPTHLSDLQASNWLY